VKHPLTVRANPSPERGGWLHPALPRSAGWGCGTLDQASPITRLRKPLRTAPSGSAAQNNAPPLPLWERSDFPDLPLQIGLGNPGEGCPAGRLVASLTKPAAPANPRRRALAGAARVVADRTRRPAGHPSPGFAKLPPDQVRGSPSETDLSHKGRGGALFCAVEPESALPGGPANPVSHSGNRRRALRTAMPTPAWSTPA